jgi:predicted nucleic-acid-binding Zn-ribbon protein
VKEGGKELYLYLVKEHKEEKLQIEATEDKISAIVTINENRFVVVHDKYLKVYKTEFNKEK